MTHLIADQLAFARTELVRSLNGVSAEEALQRFLPINSIGWIVGHLAAQEQHLFLDNLGHEIVAPGLGDRVGGGQPASTPPLDEIWTAWNAITAKSGSVLRAMTDNDLLAPLFPDNPASESIGTMVLRVTAHYWFHIGEGQAIRQLLGHTDLPSFVGPMGDRAPFRVE